MHSARQAYAGREKTTPTTNCEKKKKRMDYYEKKKKLLQQTRGRGGGATLSSQQIPKNGDVRGRPYTAFWVDGINNNGN